MSAISHGNRRLRFSAPQSHNAERIIRDLRYHLSAPLVKRPGRSRAGGPPGQRSNHLPNAAHALKRSGERMDSFTGEIFFSARKKREAHETCASLHQLTQNVYLPTTASASLST